MNHSHTDESKDMFKNDKIINPIYITIGIVLIEEDYDWRDTILQRILCEICFDILNTEKKIKWKDDKNPFKYDS